MGSTLPSKVPSPTTSPSSSSLVYIVDSPYGTPADNATTNANLVTKAHGLSDTTVLGVSSGVIGAASTTGSGNVVRATSPTLVTAALGSSTATTQSASDNSTKVATTAYTDTAVGVETTRAETAEALLAPLLSPTATKTANYNPTAGQFVPFDTTSGALSALLPNTPADKTIVGVGIVNGTNTLSLSSQGSDVIDRSGLTSQTLRLVTESMILQYQLSTTTWFIISKTPVSALQTYILASSTLTGVPTAPTATAGDNSTQVATDAFVTTAVQNGIAGLSMKDSVVAATTGSETFTIVAGTVTVIAGTTLDGQSPSNGDRILIKDAPASTGTGSAGSTQPGNGIYTIVSSVTNLTVARSSDMSGSNGPQGAFTFVEGGTTGKSTGWVVSVPATDGSFTYGTNNIKWTQFNAGGGGGVSAVSIATANGFSGSSSGGSTPALTIVAGAITPTTVNGLTISTTTGTLTMTNSKTLAVTNTLTLAGTDSTTMTFPSSSDTVVTLAATQTLTNKTLTSPTMTTPVLGTPSSGTVTNLTGTASININGTVGATTPTTGSFTSSTCNVDIYNNNAVSVSSNAGTCSVSYLLNTFTNSSAATMAITIATSGAVDGQLMIVRVYDFSAVAQTIGWTNTTNSYINAPTTSRGSTTIPLTVGLQYSSAASSWICIAWA